LHEQGRAYSEIAVFYRLQKQSEILENVFGRQQIPYEVSIRKTIKDIPALDWLVKVLRFSVNPADEQIGIEVLADSQYGEKCSRAKAKQIVLEQKRESHFLYQKMKEFSEQEKWKRTDVPEAEEVFIYFGLKEALHPTSSDYPETKRLVLASLERICKYCREKGASLIDGTREFVNQSALYGVNVLNGDGESGVDGRESKGGVSGDTVKLMTLHASKGLEFRTVFLIGMNQGLIPLHSQDFEQEEEERRLFFVGITRAKDELELSYYTNPGEPRVSGEYSRYLRMLPPHLLEWEELRSEEQKKNNLQQLRREVQKQIREKREKEKAESGEVEEKKTQNEEIEGEKAERETAADESMTVRHARHPKYGTGVLVSENDMMVEVEFAGYGRKQFLKAFGEVTIEK
jgi:superfamily I DNA/RNA helicase